MKGILHWQQRIWRLLGDYIAIKNQPKLEINEDELIKFNEKIDNRRNHIVKEVNKIITVFSCIDPRFFVFLKR